MKTPHADTCTCRHGLGTSTRNPVLAFLQSHARYYVYTHLEHACSLSHTRALACYEQLRLRISKFSELFGLRSTPPCAGQTRAGEREGLCDAVRQREVCRGGACQRRRCAQSLFALLECASVPCLFDMRSVTVCSTCRGRQPICFVSVLRTPCAKVPIATLCVLVEGAVMPRAPPRVCPS